MEMKHSRIIGLGAIGLALAATGICVRADVTPDKYAPLRVALAGKKQEALVGAEDAQFWVEEYAKFLKDPATGTDEKPALRKTLILEQARQRKLQSRATQLQAAIRNLRHSPNDEGFTLEALRAVYQDLGEFGARGRAAWDQLLEDRDASIEALQKEYREALVEATLHLEGLKTAESANEHLLEAINPNLRKATNAEFHVSLKLLSIRSAIELGFGIASKPQDPNVQAQTTLIALIAYSQFFWDHYAGVRNELGERGKPSDRSRNIFGVADGGVLMSDAIVKNQSNMYYLSDRAKEKFNGKIRAIWGSEGSIDVWRWDQGRAKNFYRACKALSSAHYNAEIWARNSEQTIAGFEAANKLLDEELDKSANEDWTPHTAGIIASTQALRNCYRRSNAVHKVKGELAELLR